jgi:hypothetical protein
LTKETKQDLRTELQSWDKSSHSRHAASSASDLAALCRDRSRACPPCVSSHRLRFRVATLQLCLPSTDRPRPRRRYRRLTTNPLSVIPRRPTPEASIRGAVTGARRHCHHPRKTKTLISTTLSPPPPTLNHHRALPPYFHRHRRLHVSISTALMIA